MKNKTPEIDGRKFSDLVKKLKDRTPHYTPEWVPSEESDSGTALLKIFASLTENIITRLNQVPRKNFASFLDTLGFNLLPAQPARVPLQFKLPEKAEKEILIPERTQASSGDVPFETEKKLLATHSLLKKVISVDPGSDAIYEPPPQFIERELPLTSRIDYHIVSFSEQGTKTLQIDPVTSLEKKDFLKIGENDTLEYAVIAEINGSILTTVDKLSYNHDANTPVEKITKFHLFEGRNIQEHILYIGHSDLFNVESAAQFILKITHMSGTESGLVPFKMIWEYWTKDDDKEDWQPFNDNEIKDGTNGLSQNGEIELTKKAGEIVEREINGIESRWIRCRLDKDELVEQTRILPQLDTIAFRVKSSGDPLPAEQAFNNETELDVGLPFNPFGTEPRLFDRFYLASGEIFSKKRAKIDINFEVDSGGILAAPAAISYKDPKDNKEKIKVFARGTQGRLIEFEINLDKNIPEYIDHRFPPDTSIALPEDGTEATPAVVSHRKTTTETTDKILIFFRAENGHLIERNYSENNSGELTKNDWVDHEMPNEIKIKFDPSAATSETNIVKVFIVGEDGSLYIRVRDILNDTSKWEEEGTKPSQTLLDSSPYAADYTDGSSFTIKVFVKGQDGRLYEWDNSTNEWVAYTLPDESLRVDSRPFAKLYFFEGKVCANVYIKDNVGSLWELDTGELDTINNGWKPLGSPSGSVIAASKPHGFFEEPETLERKHIFVRGDDNALWERTDNEWKSHQSPSDTKLRHSPYALGLLNKDFETIDSYFVYSGTNKNSIVERRNTFLRTHSGKPQVGTANTITLADNAPPDINPGSEHIEIELIEGTGKGQQRRIKAYDKGTKVATVVSSWDDGNMPNDSSTYRLLEFVNEGQVQDGSMSTITLADDSNVTGRYKDMIIVVTKGQNSQTKNITAYDGNTKKATIEGTWDPIPDNTYKYEIKAHRELKTPDQTEVMSTIKLAAEASDVTDKYTNMFIDVMKDGVETQTKKITEYTGTSEKKATIDGTWDSIPDNTYQYQIKAHQKLKVPVEAKNPINGTQATITLAGDDSDVPDKYKDMIIVVTKGQNSQTKNITAYEGDTQKATIKDTWNPIPDNTYKYEIKAQEAPKPPNQTKAMTTITLAETASTTFGRYVGMLLIVTKEDESDQKRNITAYTADRIATVSKWDKIPDNSYTYSVIENIHEGTAQVGTNNSLTLKSTAPSEDKQLETRPIILSKGESEQRQDIVTYDGSRRLITIKGTWKPKPDSTFTYQVQVPVEETLWNTFADPVETNITPELSWEYWNSKGWVAIKAGREGHQLSDTTKNFLIDGKIAFILPDDIDITDVSGQENYWIRARIVGGDYGRETFTLETKPLGGDASQGSTTTLVPSKSAIRPPKIINLSISYELESFQPPEQCLTFNNLDYVIQNVASRTPGRPFPPFVRLESRSKTIYLGFEKALQGGPIKFFFAAKELLFDSQTKPNIEWQYRAENEWKRLNFNDETEGLILPEILELIGPRDFAGVQRFGNHFYWIRGALIQGQYNESPILDGIYPNTTTAFQVETITSEVLGSSDGTADQSFKFFKFPIRKGEEVRVLEGLTLEEKENLRSTIGENAIREITDETGKIIETWVLWTEVPDFLSCDDNCRYYTLDRATGQIRFGNGKNGIIPPKGENNIKAFSYQAGGGNKGNVEQGTINSLKSAVTGIDKVINPVPADGGAETATLDQMFQIGPAVISHRNRAVTPQDFEHLAQAASRRVVKARCLPVNIRDKGQVTVIIVPDSKDDKPQPALELRSIVRQYLEEHSCITLTCKGNISVIGPSYVEIKVRADLFVKSIDEASQVEQEAREKLRSFFHPLTGGPENQGWEFGRDVSVSDIYVLLEDIKGLDHVENLQLIHDGITSEQDVVGIQDNFLVASGIHEITPLVA